MAQRRHDRAEPVYLQFNLLNSHGFDGDEEYVVPEGKKLRIEFVGVQMHGTSIGRGELHNSVALQIRSPMTRAGPATTPTTTASAA